MKSGTKLIKQHWRKCGK